MSEQKIEISVLDTENAPDEFLENYMKLQSEFMSLIFSYATKKELNVSTLPNLISLSLADYLSILLLTLEKEITIEEYEKIVQEFCESCVKNSSYFFNKYKGMDIGEHIRKIMIQE